MAEQRRWVFDPDHGGVRVPEAVQRRTAQRLRRYAEEHFAGRFTRLDIRFRGQFCYVDAFTEPEETGPNWPPPDSPETREILGRVGSSWVGDYFDTGNAAGQGRDPVEEIRQRKGLIVQIHVKGTRGADLAAGTVDLPAVKRALQETGYDDWLMLETSAGDAPLDAARRNYAVLRESLL
jgi:hypothetical protein